MMNASAKRADLEALLRARRLDRTLTTNRLQQPADATAAVGIVEIDRLLGGGFPCGQLSEMAGRRSSGRTTALHALLAAATARGEFVALVDSLDTFDPATASAAGVALDRLLWVRGPSLAHGTVTRPDGELFQRACERAIKAFNLVLQAAGTATPFVAVLDLADMPASVIRRVPFVTWRRLQRVLEGQAGAGLLLTEAPMARSARGRTLQFETPPAPSEAQTSPWQTAPFILHLSAISSQLSAPAIPSSLLPATPSSLLPATPYSLPPTP